MLHQLTTISEVAELIRAHLGLDLRPSTNVARMDALTVLIKSKHRQLWAEWDWPHLSMTVEIPTEKGQARYNVPADLSSDRLQDVTLVSPSQSGIPADLPGKPYQATYRISKGQIIFESPTDKGIARLTGIAALVDLVNPSDQVQIDGDVIALLVAADDLTSKDPRKAGQLVKQAQMRLTDLRARTQPTMMRTMRGVGQSRFRGENRRDSQYVFAHQSL